MNSVWGSARCGRRTQGVRGLCVLFVAGLWWASAGRSHARAEEFPPELVQWETSQHNPLFTGAGEGHWDELIRERGWIQKDDTGWHLWYCGYTKEDRACKLGYAKSDDGLAWVREFSHPIHDQNWVEDVQVLKHGDNYLMFAEGLNDQAQLLTSPDKLHWKRNYQIDVRQKDGEPIPPGPYGTPAVFYENGVWSLFYERKDLGIWLAQSKDLKVWHNVSDDPIVVLGPGKYDSEQIAFNQILRYKDRYYAIYHGSGSTTKPSIWTTNIAVSDDLIHWRKYSGNPLLPEADNKSSGILVHDGEQYRLYTMHPTVQVHFSKVKLEK